MLYCVVKSFAKLSNPIAAGGVLCFAFAIELAQYAQLVEKLGWQDSKIAAMVMGTSFEWIDVIAYVLGTGVILLLEKIKTPST